MFKKVPNTRREKAETASPPAMTAPVETAEHVLRLVSEQLRQAKGELSVFGSRLNRAVVHEDWPMASKTLHDLLHTAAGLSHGHAPVQSAPVVLEAAITPDSRSNEWKTAAVALLDNGIPSLLAEGDHFSERARQTARQFQALTGDGGKSVQALVEAFVAACNGHGNTIGIRQALLLNLLRQFIANIAVLSEQESWMQGQVASIETLLAGPLSVELLKAAVENLQDVAQRQAHIKNSRDSARESVEQMLQAFMASLDKVASTASVYHTRIGNYAVQLATVETAEQLQPILAGLRQETEALGEQARATTETLNVSRLELQQAQGRIQALESKLEQMSELAREDPLTKSLNRRGMIEALGREMHRARRHRLPLSIALLDIDNFKQLNDKLGHQAGDNALVHLVAVIKTTLRQLDVIARFGGEEFMLLMPNTSLDDALQAVTRIQRELTRSIFMHENQRVLVTFSAGAALVDDKETQDSLIQRVDAAMYRAKREGKNRVVPAD